MQSKKIIITGILALALGFLYGQKSVVQVVTKKIERTFAYQPGYELNVEGEKALLDIQTWDRQEISIKLELTAKHADKRVADADLEKVKYLLHRVKNKIYARNYTEEDSKGTVQATLSAQYIIMVPKECPVYLKNYFGATNVADLSNRLKINGEFTKIGLENIKGLIDINTRFGDLTANRLDGQVSLNARRSDITLRDIKGSYDIQAQYSLIQIFSADELINLNIIAEKSDVRFYDSNPAAFAYALTASHGNIFLPSMLRANYTEPSPNLKKVTFKPSTEFYPNISIRVTFGDIHIDKKK